MIGLKIEERIASDSVIWVMTGPRIIKVILVSLVSAFYKIS